MTLSEHNIYPGYGRPLQPAEYGSGEKIKESMALVARVLGKAGYVPWVFGCISARIPSSDRIFMLSHVHWAGKVLQEVTANDIRVVDMNTGKPLDCDYIDLPEDRLLHIEIFKARPDIGALIYSHPTMSCAFAAAGRDTLTLLGEKVPIMQWPEIAEQHGLPVKAQKIIDNMGKANALIWDTGSIVVGRSIEEACVNAFCLEWEAQRQLFLTVLGVTSPKPAIWIPWDDKSDFVTKIGFPWFKAMDPLVNKVDGRLFWNTGL